MFLEFYNLITWYVHDGINQSIFYYCIILCEKEKKRNKLLKFLDLLENISNVIIDQSIKRVLINYFDMVQFSDIFNNFDKQIVLNRVLSVKICSVSVVLQMCDVCISQDMVTAILKILKIIRNIRSECICNTLNVFLHVTLRYSIFDTSIYVISLKLFIERCTMFDEKFHRLVDVPIQFV